MAAGDPGSPARYYSSTAVETSLQASIPSQSQGQSYTSFIVASVSGFPQDFPYTLIVDPDTSKEEVITVTSGTSTTLIVTRGEDNTQAVAHSAGAVVRHGVSGRDFRESENHIAARGYDIDEAILVAADQTHVHGIATGDGVIVGTLKTQTLENKTLASPTITGALGGSLTFEGATADAYETTLAITDPTADRTITLPDLSGTVILTSNKVTDLTAPSSAFSMNSQKITNLATPTTDNDATNKSYVDAILGSATAAATSAASAAASATAAATSATSAAASASAASGSATAAASSATAATTSATSAAASATAAATSATSAAASATAAATSATSAAASATASANSATASASSASASATSATSAAASATAAATSAASAATSASSAATTYDQFDDRYLGDKSSDPSTDNDGNPLLTGALYFNTVLSAMKVYTGSTWQLVAPDTSNFVDKATWTAKGDLISATGASTPAALTAASTNGYVLTVNSATATGLEWAAPSAADITAVTAGTGLSGGGTSGDVTVSLDTASVYVVPSQSGQNGKYLTTNGTTASWAVVDTQSLEVSTLMGVLL